MSKNMPRTMDCADRATVVASFQKWMRANSVSKPKGRHVVRFCADMWVENSYLGDLGIPTVWGILQAAGAFRPRQLSH